MGRIGIVGWGELFLQLIHGVHEDTQYRQLNYYMGLPQGDPWKSMYWPNVA